MIHTYIFLTIKLKYYREGKSLFEYYPQSPEVAILTDCFCTFMDVHMCPCGGKCAEIFFFLCKLDHSECLQRDPHEDAYSKPCKVKGPGMAVGRE